MLMQAIAIAICLTYLSIVFVELMKTDVLCTSHFIGKHYCVQEKLLRLWKMTEINRESPVISSFRDQTTKLHSE